MHRKMLIVSLIITYTQFIVSSFDNYNYKTVFKNARCWYGAY